MKLNESIQDKINQLLESNAINYLETSERLILKNVLEKNTLSKIDLEKIAKIITKYSKFIKN
tara:strand:+ start:1194 stop:1379 length:186 start_codon:yes stop_codon:yes gene_type:complete